VAALISACLTTQAFSIGPLIDGYVPNYRPVLFIELFSWKQVNALLIANVLIDIAVLLGAKFLFDTIARQRRVWPVLQSIVFGTFISYLVAEKPIWIPGLSGTWL
jgi:hypothetical protein